MHLRVFALLPLLSALLLPPSAAAAPPAVEPLCFADVPAITDCVDPVFRPFWERNGGLEVFGYPLSPALPDAMADGPHTVQDFERYRLELHPAAPPPYTIQLGRLGADRRAQLGLDTPTARPAAPGCRVFAETGQPVCGPFLSYWRGHGLELGDPGISERESLALLGLPLGPAAWEQNSSGDRVLTQWFERARLEDHGGTIRQGRLNIEVQAALIPAAPAPGFVEVAGDQLLQSGQPIMLKGLNYYPAAQPWSHMWTAWAGPTIAAELARTRRELGGNVIRVLVPYRRFEDWSDGRGNVRPYMLDRLRELVQIAGQQQLKVIITLFDWHDGTAAAGTVEESYDLRYLETIVTAFKDDDRVLAWDLHNEPDNYPAWLGGQAPIVVDWLGRMAGAIRAIDQRHPLTVGVGRLDSLWQAGPDGRTIADLSDIVSFHSYDAALYSAQVAQVRARTTKPVLLEEFGWSSGPECRGPYFDETSQLFAYRQALATAGQPGLVGLLSWWYQDPPATLSYSVDENGYFGLYRRDGRPKLAAGPYRALKVPALPSVTTSERALTVATLPTPDPLELPIVFDDGLVIRDSFKHFWRFFGGEPVFGRPLTLAYRDSGGKVVQYFERARFELNESEHVKPIDPTWAEGQTPEVYLDRVHLTPLGALAAAGRPFPSVDDPQQPGVRYFPATGHTLRGDFLARWEQWGEIFFGPPLSEPLDETIDGQRVRVQYFTNWRFEQRGDGPVQLAPLGVDALRTRACPRP